MFHVAYLNFNFQQKKEVQKAEEAATVVTEQNSRVQIDQDSSETKQSTAPELQVENEKRECQKIQNVSW